MPILSETSPLFDLHLDKIADVAVREAFDDLTKELASFRTENALQINTMTGASFLSEGTTLITAAVAIPATRMYYGRGASSILKTTTASIDLLDVNGTLTSTTSTLASDAAARQKTVVLTSAAGFSAGDWIVLQNPTGTPTTVESDTELNKISSIATNTLTMVYDLKDAYTTALSAAATVVTLKEDVIVRDIRLTNVSGGSGKSLDISYAKNIKVQDIISDNGRTNINYCNDVQILGLQHYGDSTSSGLRCDYSDKVIYDSCNVYDADTGIIIYYNSNNCTVKNCTVQNTVNDGIVVNYWSEDCLVEGNTVTEIGRYGILVDFTSDNCKVIGNTVENVVSTAITSLDYGHALIGNVVKNCAVTAIALEDARHQRVIGNKIQDCGTTTAHHGILGSGTVSGCHYNIISGNDISGVSGECISITSAIGNGDGNIITNNTLDVDHRGIVIGSTCINTQVKNNSFKGSAGQSTWIINASATTIGDRVYRILSPIDLSGSAIANQHIFTPQTDGVIIVIRVIFTEATSADTAKNVLIGKVGSTGHYLNIPDASATLVSKAIWDQVAFTNSGSPAEGILSAGVTTAGADVILNYPVAKTGAGEIMIELEWCSFGEG